MAGSRPIGVTLVFIIILIEGVLALIGGIVGLFVKDMNLPLVSALILVLVGIVYLAVAKGLANGNSFSRLLVGIVTVIAFIGGIWTLLTASGQRITGAVEAVIALIVLALLYSSKAKQFFN